MGGFLQQFGTAGPGSQSGNFPTAAPAVLIPREFTHNQDLPVPGLASTSDYGNSEHNGAAAGAYQPEGAVSMSDALKNFLILGATDSNGTRSLQEQLIQAGYLNPDPKRGNFSPGQVASGDSSYNAYAKLVNDAIVTGQSIDSLLNKRINDPKNTTGQRYWKTYAALTGSQPMEKTYTSTATQYSTTGDAYSLAQDEYQKYLGRDANAHEVGALHAALNAYEKAHPTQTTKDVSYDPSMGYGGLNEKNVVQSGGSNAGDSRMVADNQIQGQDAKELGQVQSDRLVQVFEQMLGNGHG